MNFLMFSNARVENGREVCKTFIAGSIPAVASESIEPDRSCSLRSCHRRGLAFSRRGLTRSGLLLPREDVAQVDDVTATCQALALLGDCNRRPAAPFEDPNGGA